jgi:hypothetical protein
MDAAGRYICEMDRNLGNKLDKSLEKQDIMIEKQDNMLEKQDIMIGKQDSLQDTVENVFKEANKEIRLQRIEKGMSKGVA